MDNMLMEFCSIKNYDFGEQPRTITIDGELWYMGKDLCRMVGDKNHKRSLKRLEDEDKKKIVTKDAKGRTQVATYVNESGFYDLLLSMQPEKANHKGDAYPPEVQARIEIVRQFRYWVTHDVLPSIRKYGMYISPRKLNEFLSNPENARRILELLRD